jgi:hypothetical protein
MSSDGADATFAVGDWLHDLLLLISRYVSVIKAMGTWLLRSVCQQKEEQEDVGVVPPLPASQPQDAGAVALVLEDAPAALPGRRLLEVRAWRGWSAPMIWRAHGVPPRVHAAGPAAPRSQGHVPL